MNVYDIKRTVDYVAEKLNIENVSEMTVDQLTSLITESIHSTITSSDYAEEIDRMLGDILRRHTRGY